MRMLIPIVLLVAGLPATAQESAPESASQPAEPSPTPSPAPPKRALEGGRSNNLPKGSSLADVVRRSQADKPEAKRSLGVITNDTLKGGPAGPGAKTGTLNIAPKTVAKGGTPSSTSKVEPLPSVEVRDDKGRTEADWRNIIKKTQERVDKTEAEAKRLEDEVQKLENDFYAWSDGNYRDGVIKPTLDKAREDLKKARLDIDSARGAQADLEEDARKSNTPPGWLRQK